MSATGSALTYRESRRAIVLDAEQQAAITQPGNVVVRAGAGSGKTEILARRFVALLAGDLTGRTPLDPAALAAITFTERAALDLRQRIGVVLAERIAEEEVAPASSPELRRHLARAQHTLALARISTIHAFCARILRENPFAAGLDPDFEVLDEEESGTFFERVARKTLIEAVRAGNPGAHFLVRARGLTGNPQREGAIEIVQRILSEARRAGYQADWILAETARSARRAESEDPVAAHAKRLVFLVDQLLELRPSERGASDLLEQLWPTVRQAVLAFDETMNPAAITILRDICAAMPDARGKTRRVLVNEIKNLVDSTTTRFGVGGLLVGAWGERRAAVRAIEVARLVAQVDAALDRAMADERVLTFDDLLIGARDLLRDHPEVATRYQTELRALLVDEYQDTNVLQDALVARLTTPAGIGAAPAPELFIVGDEKQSIYRFRGADVRVFNLPRTPDPCYLPLAGNRRSTPNILNFVNGLSAVAMRPESEPCPPYRIAWRPGHALTVQRATPLDYPVEIIAAIDGAHPEIKLHAAEKRRREARAIAARIVELVAAGEPITDPVRGTPRATEYRDIVVLFRAFPEIGFYEDALNAAAVPCYTVQGRGFYGRREVIDLVAMLAAVDDPRDALQLAAALRSPFFGLSDDCLLELGLRLHTRDAVPRFTSLAEMFAAGAPDFSWLSTEREQVARAWSVLRELRELGAHLSLPAIVERALELTDYESVMAGLAQGRQRIANLRKVVDLAHRFDTRRFFTFHDFVTYLRRLTETEPYEPQAQILGETDDVVRLMTIHQAKGLEFPIVILADAGRRLNREKRSPLLDPERGLLVQDTDGSGADEIPNAALAMYRQYLNDQEEAESVRILYVAMTRARDRLIVSEGSGTAGWSKALRRFVGIDAWTRLARTGGAPLELACAGARVVLRQADCGARITTNERLRKLNPAILSPAALEGASGASSAIYTPEGEAQGLRLRPWAAVADSIRMRERGLRRAHAVISPTALADFDRCPRQYWLRHGLGLPERFAGRMEAGGDTAALGLVAHAVLERIQFAAGGAQLGTEIAELTERLGRAAGLSAEDKAGIARDLSRYVAARPAGEIVVGREIPFMLHAAPSLFVRGQIDLIAHAGEQVIVRDYKYSTASHALRYQLQMECYALAALTALDKARVLAQVVALRENPAPINVPIPTADAIRLRLNALGEQLAAARRDDDYPRKPGDAAACRALGCGYVARCWRH